MNKLLFMPDSARKKLARQLTTQFALPVEDVFMYGKKELLGFYENKKVPQEIVEGRKKSYLMLGTGNGIKYKWGSESEVIITDFLSQNSTSTPKVLRGIVANRGKIKGRVTVIKYGDNAFSRLPAIVAAMPQGNILVAETTAPELLMACKKASGILTNQGGMMSHAAIVSRELNIPCIVGLRNITELVKDGDLVEVDAERGVVTILKKE
jgi:phosphoenolpyruvate synthase/pyruvate phosphate dikinase